MTISHHLRYLWYLAAGATAVPALRLGKSWWDADYARDSLARTEGHVELPRHLLVAGLISHYAPGGSILDVGCGTGGLTTPLRACTFTGSSLRYLGVDQSDIALEQAAARRNETGTSVPDDGTVKFVEADFDEYEPSEAFDALVFSESLYYAPDPMRTVLRYTQALSDNGIIVVSMWRRPSRGRLWRELAGALHELSRSRIVVPRRPAWDIVLYTTTASGRQT